MFFPEITGNKCMKFLQNVVFTTDLFFDNGLSGKKICYIQKQRIARCLYTPEKEMMFNIHQMHQYFQLLMDDLSFILCQLNRILLIPPQVANRIAVICVRYESSVRIDSERARVINLISRLE